MQSLKMIKQISKLLLNCMLILFLTGGILYLLNERYVADYWYNPNSSGEKFSEIPEQVLVANVGSSHGLNAFVYEDLESRGISCFNFSMASQSYDYDYGLIQMYQEHLAPGGILFIPVSYFSFNDEVVNDSEKKSMSARYYSFMEPKYIPNYSLYTDLVTQKMPILSAEEDFLDWLLSSLSLKVHAAEENILSQEEMMERSKQRFDRHFNNKPQYVLEERVKNLKDIVTFCQEREITPVLITLPVNRYYYELIPEDFFPSFYDAIAQVCDSTGAAYYDYGYDPRFRGNLSYFFDCDHLNHTGALYFMSLIEEEIPEFKEVIKGR